MGVQAFGDLSKRNVKVTILTNSLASNDEPLVHTGYARYRVRPPAHRRRPLRAEPDPLAEEQAPDDPGASLGRLHAKTAVIDRNLVFIGSMNLDPRSASKNTELGIIIESPELAKEVLRVIHISKLQSAYRLRLAQRRAQPRVADHGRRQGGRPGRRARHDVLSAAARYSRWPRLFRGSTVAVGDDYRCNSTALPCGVARAAASHSFARRSNSCSGTTPLFATSFSSAASQCS